MQFFDDLPSGRTVREEAVDWAKVKADLMENPGRWGLMAENISSSTPGQLRAGKNRNFRGPELAHFEFRVRNSWIDGTHSRSTIHSSSPLMISSM